jgi:hypothetical protein
MAWTVLERLLQTLQGSGGATGGPRRAQGVCASWLRSGRGRGHGGAARGQQQARPGWRGARPAQRIASSESEGALRNVRCNHSWNHACSEASDPRRDGHSAGAAN